MHEPAHGAGNFAEQERSRVEAELADLRRRRDQMRAELRDDADTVGDRGDAADAIQRAEDLAGIDEQIARLTWLLAGGNTAVEGQLPNGTQVTIRFPGDEPVRMRVVHFLEETPAGAEDTTLTADSPLGLALVGRKAGDTVIYDTRAANCRSTCSRSTTRSSRTAACNTDAHARDQSDPAGRAGVGGVGRDRRTGRRRRDRRRYCTRPGWRSPTPC